MKKIRLTGEIILRAEDTCEKDITALLAEYSSIKAEEAACEQTQMQIATAVFSFIAAIVGLNFFFQKKGSMIQGAKYMLLGFCPLLVMFFGCLWMYQLYCHMRFGAYLYHLEEDINRCYPGDEQKMYFEHWIVKQEDGKKFFGKTSRLYGYFTLGTWLTAPVLLLFFVAGLFPNWDVTAFYLQNVVLTVFLSYVLLLYYIIQFSYLSAILKFKNKKSLSQPRI